MNALFLATIQLFTGLLLLLSAAAKLRDLPSFERALAGYEILPLPLLRPFRLLVPLSELALGAALLLHFEAGLAAGLSALLLVAFGAAIALNLRRGRSDIDCGCSWGSSTAGGGIARWMIMRNAVIAAAVCLSIPAGDPRALGAVELWSALAAAVVFLCLYHALPVLLMDPRRPPREVEWT